ncbi:MAG: hypothetical protein WBE37_28415 [Bryobacteraceae bacterium]
MIALLVCVAAFAACYWAGRRSLGQGLVMLLAFGYFYGILRANLLTAFSHFIFDAGLLGLYASFRWFSPADANRSKGAQLWTILLIIWPIVLVPMPFQPLLISLVGLRGAIFFIPLLLLGSRLKSKDLLELSLGLAVLDFVAIAFAGAEYFLGVERFFPISPVTQIMYASQDVAGGFFRIPSIFSSAAAFGGMMIGSIPFLVGLWMGGEKHLHRMIGLAAIPAALLGVLMSATRSNFIFGCAIVTFLFFKIRMSGSQRMIFILVMAVVAYAALSNARFQRFKSLDDTDYVSDRIAGSVNRGFFEILLEYPMGNGLGGGGTSIPYFLQGEVRNPIGMENEYARILCEQGVIGLFLWLGFLVWFFQRMPVAFANGSWATTRRLSWCLVAIGFGTAFIGTGLLTSIPGTVLIMIGAGWTTVPPEKLRLPVAAPRQRGLRPVHQPPVPVGS